MDEKTPEPTKLQTDFIFEKMQNEIDRLTTENKVLKGSLKPETKVDEFMAEWDEFLRVCRPDDSTFLRALRIIQQYRAELQAKNKEIADHFTGITKKAKQA